MQQNHFQCLDNFHKLVEMSDKVIFSSFIFMYYSASTETIVIYVPKYLRGEYNQYLKIKSLIHAIMFKPPKLKDTFKTLETIIYTLYPALKIIDVQLF